MPENTCSRARSGSALVCLGASRTTTTSEGLGIRGKVVLLYYKFIMLIILLYSPILSTYNAWNSRRKVKKQGGFRFNWILRLILSMTFYQYLIKKVIFLPSFSQFSISSATTRFRSGMYMVENLRGPLENFRIFFIFHPSFLKLANHM